MSFKKIFSIIYLIKFNLVVSLIISLGFLSLMWSDLNNVEFASLQLPKYQYMLVFSISVTAMLSLNHNLVFNQRKFYYTLPYKRITIMLLPILSMILIPLIIDITIIMPIIFRYNVGFISGVYHIMAFKYLLIAFFFMISRLCDNTFDLAIWVISIIFSIFFVMSQTNNMSLFSTVINVFSLIDNILVLVLLSVILFAFMIGITIVIDHLKYKYHRIETLYFISKILTVIAFYSLFVNIIISRVPVYKKMSLSLLNYNFSYIPIIIVIGISIAYLKIICNNMKFKQIIISVVVLLVFTLTYALNNEILLKYHKILANNEAVLNKTNDLQLTTSNSDYVSIMSEENVSYSKDIIDLILANSELVAFYKSSEWINIEKYKPSNSNEIAIAINGEIFVLKITDDFIKDLKAMLYNDEYNYSIQLYSDKNIYIGEYPSVSDKQITKQDLDTTINFMLDELSKNTKDSIEYKNNDSYNQINFRISKKNSSDLVSISFDFTSDYPIKLVKDNSAE